MKNYYIRFPVIFFASVLCAGLPPLAHSGELIGSESVKFSSEKLIGMLKNGGYVIYTRHGLTETIGEKKVTTDKLGDCKTQRNLSQAGRDQSAAIREAIRTHKVPIGNIYSSPYCRCMDTARLAFGEPTKSDNLHFAIHLDRVERRKVTSSLKDMLGRLPTAGTSTVLVSHTANLMEATGIWPKQEGESHVFLPDGHGDFEYLGKIEAHEWDQ